MSSRCDCFQSGRYRGTIVGAAYDVMVDKANITWYFAGSYVDSVQTYAKQR